MNSLNLNTKLVFGRTKFPYMLIKEMKQQNPKHLCFLTPSRKDLYIKHFILKLIQDFSDGQKLFADCFVFLHFIFIIFKLNNLSDVSFFLLFPDCVIIKLILLLTVIYIFLNKCFYYLVSGIKILKPLNMF